MTIEDAFDEIMQYAHYWNWVPDWQLVKEIYESYPYSYSVLTPFVYTYFEELIRTTTIEYGLMLPENKYACFSENKDVGFSENKNACF